MMSTRHKLTAFALTLAAAVMAAMPASSPAAEPPVKETAETVVGWEVNKDTKGSICVLALATCQAGQGSEAAGGFRFPEGIAVGPAPQHNVYVTEKVNGRVQVFTPTGAFVSMFGWDVNKTRSGEPSATQSQKDTCTAEEISKEAVECQAGQEPGVSGRAGQVAKPTSIAVDQGSGDVYVLDYSQHRIEKYTASGEFMLMIGGEVNKKDKSATLCTKAEEAECKSGVESAKGALTHGWLKPVNSRGDLLAIGPGGVLYAGDEGRIEEFDETGKYLREIQVPGSIGAVAVSVTGETFVTEKALATSIYKFTGTGEEVRNEFWPLALSPKEADAELFGADTLAIDPAGHLAVSFYEHYHNSEGIAKDSVYGDLLNSITGEQITGFTLELSPGVPFQSPGIAFSTGEAGGGFHGYPMYAVIDEQQKFVAYKPLPAGELVVKGDDCVEAAETETDVRLNCALLGEVNPEGVPETVIWFEWGRTPALGEVTPRQVVCEAVCGNSPVSVEALVEGVRPNESGFYFEMAGEDANVKGPERLESHNPKQDIFTTPIVQPLVLGEPEQSFVRYSTAVMFSELNPENASTEYFFEYTAGAKTLSEQCPKGVRHVEAEGQCGEVGVTAVGHVPCQSVKGLQECEYGAIGATSQADGLRPATFYRYRMFAEAESKDGKEHTYSLGQEGTFTTAQAPVPQATTGDGNATGATSAVISGSVNPDGRPATYVFELGVYAAAATQYGIVLSGPVAASTLPVLETLQLTGLQPDTMYAYRIGVKGGYGESTGAMRTFTTGALASLAGPVEVKMLKLPPFEFPVESKCGRGYVRDKHGKCVKAKAKSKKGKKVKRTHRAAPRSAVRHRGKRGRH